MIVASSRSFFRNLPRPLYVFVSGFLTRPMPAMPLEAHNTALPIFSAQHPVFIEKTLWNTAFGIYYITLVLIASQLIIDVTVG
jgi:hypothetical protein